MNGKTAGHLAGGVAQVDRVAIPQVRGYRVVPAADTDQNPVQDAGLTECSKRKRCRFLAALKKPPSAAGRPRRVRRYSREASAREVTRTSLSTDGGAPLHRWAGAGGWITASSQTPRAYIGPTVTMTRCCAVTMSSRRVHSWPMRTIIFQSVARHSDAKKRVCVQSRTRIGAKRTQMTIVHEEDIWTDPSDGYIVRVVRFPYDVETEDGGRLMAFSFYTGELWCERLGQDCRGEQRGAVHIGPLVTTHDSFNETLLERGYGPDTHYLVGRTQGGFPLRIGSRSAVEALLAELKKDWQDYRRAIAGAKTCSATPQT